MNPKGVPRSVADTQETLRAVPIHQRPDLLLPCADLVNSEWQRSQAARVHSLHKSCSEFPVCLVLLRGRRETEQLLGHARLSRVVGHNSSLFVESVVVSKSERGKGYGRTLMEETERYANSRGFKRLYLTTHDKQHFYNHMGYVLSAPVQNAGAMTAFVPMETLLKFSRPSTQAQIRNTRVKTSGDASSNPSQRLPPPPPPPPSLPKPPSGPVPPPPPLANASSPPRTVVQTLTETPYRDAKGMPVFWMHKDI